ncbi:hypothetical protein D3C80_1609750 [compost metagenome]
MNIGKLGLRQICLCYLGHIPREKFPQHKNDKQPCESREETVAALFHCYTSSKLSLIVAMN